MTTRMLIDAAHPEETRVVVVKGSRIEEFDFESAAKKQLKGNIYLAKVTRVEPSLQAAFIEYGGNRHGFLAFNEIHPDYYQIPVEDRQALIEQEMAAQAAAADEEDAEAEALAERGGQSADEDAADEHEAEEAIVETVDTSHEVHSVGGGADSEETGKDSHDEARPASIAENAAPAPSVSTESQAPVWTGEAAGDPSLTLQPVEQHEAADGATEAGESEESSGEDRGRGGNRRPRRGKRRRDGEEGDDNRARQRVMRAYKIQEVIKRRQILLVQVVKEERGNKGAALTTYISLAGRYCVLMPNTARGGGISRKIVNQAARKKLKEAIGEFDVPGGMGVIIRTAGMNRTKQELRRDYEYLLRLWDGIREFTLQSTAPALIYEEADLIKRSIRDLYTKDIDEVLVEGEQGHRVAHDFMRMLLPSQAERVQRYNGRMPLFHAHKVEAQLEHVHSPTVQLRSGGYIVINQTEALVAIDVNSGRSTREHNIEETALRTNLEAAEEVARQLRLRDLAGLVVIDFIDMERSGNDRAVERRLKEALKADRARIQMGRISPFGLLELSRQRIRPSLFESSMTLCPHCTGVGFVRSTESSALHVLRAIEEEGLKDRAAEIAVHVSTDVALYLLNNKRAAIHGIEHDYGMRVLVTADEALVPPNFRLDRLRIRDPLIDGERPVERAEPMPMPSRQPIRSEFAPMGEEIDAVEEAEVEEVGGEEEAGAEVHGESQGGERGNGEARADDRGDADGGRRGGRRRRRRRRGGDRPPMGAEAPGGFGAEASAGLDADAPAGNDDFDIPEPGSVPAEAARDGEAAAEGDETPGSAEGANRRRRGRRGRRRGRDGNGHGSEAAASFATPQQWVEIPIGTDPPAEPASAPMDWSERPVVVPRHAEPVETAYRPEPVIPAHVEAPVVQSPVEAPMEPPQRVEPVIPLPPVVPPAAVEPMTASAAPPPAPAASEPEPRPEPEPEPAAQPMPPPYEVLTVAPPAEPRRRGWWKR